ncbi:MAG TPA: hypothetical protein PLQ42_07470 [Candidatus Hydrogenedentes bacterium]|nr:hypothetical protein [Candidatus Hydrogenedentota bacterium]HOM47353.1 hypothetical protein [Candidatus Hydrogenedentota bacterium]HOR50903.1 hypothetical protein [Candidatus Hydrogenedentota bacterium]HPK24594.1 hypothetical protein [Candidatus Hydrogenedentota bacterium]HPX86406.1 hypothetical protein [Candidatus Hydrogenedentota bacterium]
MIRWMPAFFLLCIALPVLAQTSMGGYSSMEIEAGRMKGNFATGSIDEMTGGVRLKLLSEDPATKPLPVAAGSMKFTWGEGKTTPATIVMEKDVKVDHPQASITAQRAEWNFETGDLVFSGNPVVNSEQLKGLRGEKMLLNLKNNTFEVLQVRADEVPLKASEGAAAASAPSQNLTAREIKNWSALIDAIKKDAGQDRPSAGKQIMKHLNAQNQQLLVKMDTALLVERKEDLLRLINSVLAQPGFYSADAWQGITLPDAVKESLVKEDLSKEDRVAVNKTLLKAAYPFAFNE